MLPVERVPVYVGDIGNGDSSPLDDVSLCSPNSAGESTVARGQRETIHTYLLYNYSFIVVKGPNTYTKNKTSTNHEVEGKHH